MKLILMRHGQTDCNAQRRYTGTTDIPLNAEGVAQAQAAGRAVSVRRVYVSPLVRARQTARICFPNAGQQIEAGLTEISFGIYQGRGYTELAGDPSFDAWYASRWNLPAPGGQTRGQHQITVVSTIRRIVCEALVANASYVVCVCHGGVIMACMDALAVTDEPRDYFSWNPGNCGLLSADVKIEGDGLEDAGALNDRLQLVNVRHHTTVGFIDEL